MKNLGKKIGIGVVVLLLIVILIFSLKPRKKDENTFIMGLDDSFPPMGFRNENNEIVGFDIDVANEVCKKLNLELKLQPISWAAKQQEIDSGNIDCIWNGFGYTEERDKSMTLSEPYIKSKMIFIVKNDSPYQTQEDLQNKKIGVQTGSTGQEDIEASDFGKNLGEIVQYSDQLTALMDLDKGGIDGVYILEGTGRYLTISKNKDYRMIDSVGIKRASGMVVAFKKGNTELRDKVQNALYELKKEGILKTISEKWFGTDITSVENK